MLIEAYKLLEGVPAQHLPQLLNLFTKTATEICEGQQYDVDFEQRNDVQISDYIEMIRLKTSVLLAAALKGGAIIGGATEAEQEALYNYGIHLGLAFQIQDDLLDCFGDPATFGKIATQAREAAEQAIEQHTAEALACLSILPDNHETRHLEQMARSLAQRKS